MGDLTRGFTFSGSPATATVAEIHALVDDAVVKAGTIDSTKLASNSVADATKVADNAITGPKLGVSPFFVQTVAGTADALTINSGQSLTVYTDGDVICFKATLTNLTATPTLQVDTAAAQNIVCAGAPLKPGDIQAGFYYTVRESGSTFQLLSPRSSGNLEVSLVAGTADVPAITLASSYEVPDYYDGLLLRFKPVADNTGAVDLDLNVLGVKDLFKNLDEELDAGDLLTGQEVTVIYDGTSFQLVSGQDLAKVAVVAPDFATDSFLFIEEVEAGGVGGNIKQTPMTSLTPKIATLSDTKASGTAGGTATAGAWTKHVLTTEVDASSITTLDTGASTFVPIAGTYLVQIVMAFGQTDGSRCRLYNTTQASEVARSIQVKLSGEGLVSLSSTFIADGVDAYEVQWYCTTSHTTNGLGAPLTVAGETEKYLEVVLTKIQ